MKHLLASIFASFAAAQAIAETPEAAVAPPLESADILSDADAERYQRIFALHEDARWREADTTIAALEDDVLMGYVLSTRYLHPSYRSSFDELKKWMAFYADHPHADKIYALSIRKRPKRETGPQRPLPRRWRVVETSDFHPEIEKDYAAKGRASVARFEGRVRTLCKAENATTALTEIDARLRAGAITERQADRMRSWAAASLYYQGYVDAARDLSERIAARNGETAVLAYWIAGLGAFRDGDMERAAAHFGAMAQEPHQEDALRAGAGFWAARAALAAGRLDAVTPNLRIASKFPYTFYGQLAAAQLGEEPAYHWEPPAVTASGFAALVAAEPRVKRAVALAEAGLAEEADLELRWANGAIEPPLDRDLLAVAAALRLPAAQIDIALSGRAPYLEPGLFPIPDYAPAGGFDVDRALLYALMRQESKFKVEATSRVGARGLMQLMPRTASYVAKDRSLQRAAGKQRLYDPSLNLDLGQTYVRHLISTSADGNLFNMALAYNGGPGNLSRWKRDLALDDPLLFIESIPNPESRDFVEKVLTNVWIYHARLGQTPLTRDKVAAGELPLYEALDTIAAE